MNLRNVLINSTILFTLASTAETILHESGHFICAWMFSAPDLSLHHNYVNYNSDVLHQHQRILIAAAGPLISLAIGLICHYITKQYRNPNLIRLFLLYMGIFGYIGFFGYLMVAPFFAYGDTGFVLRALNVSIPGIIGVAVTGTAILAFVMFKICGEFVPFLSQANYEADPTRKKTFNFLVHIPLYLGIAATTLLNVPVPTFLSLIAPVFSPFSIMWAFPALMRKQYAYPAASGELSTIDRLSPAWFFLLLFTILMNRILVTGISA
jgi:hypothetical protein